MKSKLEQVAIPDQHGARDRAWVVVAAAFEERKPVERKTHRLRPVIALAVVLAFMAAAVSAPGRAVIDDIREAVGVERAETGLFSLPESGSLLVASDAGVWVVQQDGSKRLLGAYREATWSPFGRFVAAAGSNELAALEPDGRVRWTLSRPGATSPRWTGTATDTRIAYVDRSGIRLVAGDGTGDSLLVPGARGPVAWRPGVGFVLAYTTPRSVRVVDLQKDSLVWQARRPEGQVTAIDWSSDGRQLLVLSPHHLRVYDERGELVEQEDPSEGWPEVAAAFRPRSHQVAVARVHGSQSTAYVLPGRTLFNGFGVFRDLAWAPDGRWLLVTWPTADQWVFVEAAGRRRVRGVGNVAEQFRTRSAPRIEGWCCEP